MHHFNREVEMGWFDDYDRNYRNDRSFGRGGRPAAYGNMGAQNGLGYWGSPYGYWGGSGYDRSYRDSGADQAYRGRGGYDRDFGYDRMYRRPPSESPTYGRQADQEVQRWATRHGYDAGYTIQPRGDRGGMSTNRGMQQGGRGGYSGRGQQGEGWQSGGRNLGRNDWGGRERGWGSSDRSDYGYGW
jgi:hypothetical protein